MKKILWVIPFIFLLTACGGNDQKNSSTSGSSTFDSEAMNQSETENTTESTQEILSETTIPTLFFHGYSGTKGSFANMLNDLVENNGGNVAKVLTVDNLGNVKEETQNPLKEKDLIQVIFTDNKNNEWNQAQWLGNTLRFLQNEGIEKVNLVGHSMGGVDILRYLLTDTPEITINKIITIGAPFNEFITLSYQETMETVLQSGPEVLSNRYQELSPLMNQFPKEISWLNIAGEIVENDPNQGDGTVPLPSALSMTYDALSEHLTYENKIFTGKSFYHSGLHESEEVNQVISEFLWEK